ncbi:UNVERIFIED_CONTAM: hypothetical protein RF653_10080 [Kocuria sp. CPCC 205316]|uniref:hypothetical protein n=1 Tax=Kocuria TaxID=57493 RepID=UPI0036DCC6D5
MPIVFASIEDPVATVTHPTTNATVTCRIPSEAALSGGTDKNLAVIQPDGRTIFEFYAMTQVDSTDWTSTYTVQNDLFGSGITAGARASGTSLVMGIIRKAEIASLNIPHTLTLGLPNTVLQTGFVWPARSQDGDGATAYTGTVPMGSLFAIPPSVDLSLLTLTPEGAALATALQDYGAHVMRRADTAALYAEVASDDAATLRMRSDWQATLFPLVRAVTNNSSANVSGGGIRRRPPAAPLR